MERLCRAHFRGFGEKTNRILSKKLKAHENRGHPDFKVMLVRFSGTLFLGARVKVGLKLKQHNPLLGWDNRLESDIQLAGSLGYSSMVVYRA